MMALVEDGKIGTVITKDMSRIGRNYLEVGMYTEITFPQNNVRFIAVNSGVDSANQQDNEFVPFVNIINEYYVRDGSKKVRASLKLKGESGEHLTTIPPYGYVKDTDHSEHWLVDPEAAQVVKRIFSLCMDGNGPTQIARMLKEDHVLTPTVYQDRQKRKVRCALPENPYNWNGSTVAAILERMEYCGHTVNFKTHRQSYKIKKTIENPPEQWKIFRNTHEAIVDEDTFQRVQELRRNKRRPARTGKSNLFSGVAYCADCGEKMYYCTSRNFEERFGISPIVRICSAISWVQSVRRTSRKNSPQSADSSRRHSAGWKSLTVCSNGSMRTISPAKSMIADLKSCPPTMKMSKQS